MKIVLMEPLGVSSEIIEKLADGLVSAGHTFASYDTFTTDTDELIRRAGDADILMIANHPSLSSASTISTRMPARSRALPSPTPAATAMTL